MAILKIALCEAKSINLDKGGHLGFIKTASGRVFVEPGSDKARIIEAEISKHPTALFFRSKAIKADEMNSNGDYFPEEELIKSYKSFEGVPFFTNHDNQNVENARGKVIFAEWVPEEKAVYVISFVDREAFPHICRSIEEEYINGVSMGASIEYSVCSICHNRAEKIEQYCDHIKNRKARKFTGKAKDCVTGEVKSFKDADVFEYNYGVKFIELSAVVDPACQSCRIDGIVPNENYLQKAANLQQQLFIIKTSAINKKAGQEEIDQLNTCLSTLEEISIKLIQNREQVEMDFASDLVNILSELQTFVDELVGAGFANVQGQQKIPGVSGNAEEGLPNQNQTTQGQLGGTAPAIEAMEVSQTTPASPAPKAGTISGAPGKPLVQTPQMPITAPAKPMAFDLIKIKKMSGITKKLGEFRKKLNATGENSMAKRRSMTGRIEQKKQASEVLSNSWQEKQGFVEYINKVPSIQDNNNKLSIKKRDDSFIVVAESKDDNITEQMVWTYEDLDKEEKELIQTSPKEAASYFLNTFANSLEDNKKEGVRIMTDQLKEAGANSVNKTPEVTQEVQLEQQRDLYHAREGKDRNSITEKQLADDKGSHKQTGEKDVITEAQLQAKTNKLNPVQDDERETTQEVQLEAKKGASPRKNEEWNEITQSQLDSNGNRVNKEQDVITEKQLDKVPTPWERMALRNASMFKSAGEHMNSVIDVMADTVISTGCTPQEASVISSSLVSSTKGRFELGNAMLEDIKEEGIDYSKRLAYWSKKNIKVASVGSDAIASAIVSGLRRVVADVTINPEVIIDAIDVISEGQEGVDSISKRVDEKLQEAANVPTVASKKNELRQALKNSISTKEERDEERNKIIASTEKKEKSEKNSEKPQADTMIEATFKEIGLNKSAKRDATFKKAIASYTRGALASQNIKLAAITNVTINGDTISIAVQTDEGAESVEIPAGGAGTSVPEESIVPEGDMSGEGLGSSLPPPAADANKKMKKTAQAPMGGGMPGAPGGAATGAPEMGLEGPAPAEQTPVETLTTDQALDEEVSDEIPTAGEQQMPYAICPECGSNDVDIERKGEGNISGNCNKCGAEYEALIKKEVEFKIVKPTVSVGEEGGAVPEEPEVPALPVAAQTKLGKDVIVRIASNKEKYGHVCPACGMGQCKVASENNGDVKYTCPACHTDVEKDIVVNVNNPEESYLRVKWDLIPNIKNCATCKEAAKKFASFLKVEKMIKSASNTKSEFPMANCRELVAKKFGGNSTASFGPCKGKLLADCVCGQLEKLGLRTVRHVEKLASVSMQEDPYDTCIKEQKANGFDMKKAEHICNCMQKKFANKIDDGFFTQAFMEDVQKGKEKILTAQDLSVIDDIISTPDEGVESVEEFEDVDLGSETVTLEISKETATELADAAAAATSDSEAEVEIDLEDEVGEVSDNGAVDEVVETEIIDETPAGEVVDEEPAITANSNKTNPKEEKEMAMSMQTHKLRRVGEEVVKIAGQPKKVEDIEGNVEAGVPRAKATMGNEGADNIDVPMAKPSVPRAKATMGNEGSDNIDVPAALPDVAVDSAYMGQEKSMQKGMPEINNEIKGTVIAKDKNEGKKIAKKMPEVDTVEGEVEAGVPRSKATIGNEGADNIDVPMAKPDVPRAKATIGNEGPDNIDVPADAPDVPIDNAYMGDEKAVQKDMPAINDQMLKNVKMKREVQQERIATARKMEAVKVASKLLATKRISEEAYDDVIDSLANFEVDKIASKAEKMYPKAVQTKTASAEQHQVHSGTAIVLESKASEEKDQSMSKRIGNLFTLNGRQTVADFDKLMGEDK